MNQFYTTTISKITRITRDAVNIEIAYPPHVVDKFNFKAGQYLVIRIPDFDKSEHRSYSISSAPNEQLLRIGLKKLEGGLISTHLVERAKAGDSIDIMPPQGSFILPETPSLKKIVAFVAGSGITPVLSIIKDQLSKSNENKILLMFGNKTSNDRMYFEELKELENKFPSGFEVIHVYSRETTGMKNFEGRIDADKISNWKDYLFEIKNTDAFLLCGPGSMVVSLESALLQSGVRPEKIYTELFTSPIEGTNITPAEVPEKASDYVLEYKLNGKWHTIKTGTNHDVLLDIGINHGLDLPYSCKSGVCSTCQAKLLSGEVKMDNNYVLSDKELKQGYILTCQSHAMTAAIKVDYDMK